MKEEKIEELNRLLDGRRILRNEIEAFQRVDEVGQEHLGFWICNADAPRESSYIHFIKDHYGYMYEALQKVYARLQKELEYVQKKIDEF